MSKAMISLTALATALALKDDADEAAVLASIDQLKARADASDQVLASARTELGLADDADSESVLASITQAKAGGEPDPAEYVPIADLKDVQARLGAIEEEKVLATVDQAVAAGKITPGQKDWAIKLGKKDVGELQSYLDITPGFGAGRTVDGKPKTEKGKLTEDERAICSQQGLTEEEFLAARDEEEAA